MKLTCEMIHQRLKEIRVKNGFTQQEVAHHLHMTQNTISKIERGNQKIDIDLLLKFTSFYKIAPHELLNGDSSALEYLEIKKVVSEFNECITVLNEQLRNKDYQIEMLMTLLKEKKGDE